MNSPFKFLRRVRIHGRECGAVARALHHGVKGLSLYQADSGKALGSTIERKQMSTKTTLKRIALVAVSALGASLVSVAPASAAFFVSAAAGSGTTVSVSASVSGGKALRVGVQSAVVATFTGPAVTAYSDDSGTISAGGYAASAKVSPNIKLLVAPATSAVAVTSANAGANLAGLTGLSVGGLDTSTLTGLPSAPTAIGHPITRASGSQAAAVYSGILFTPDKAGTYTFMIWDDVNADGALGGSTEKYVNVTFVVGSSISSITSTTTINNGETDTTHYSAVIKICLKDENGAATVPSGADSVKASTSGSATWKYSFVQGSSTLVSGSGTADAYLVAADFDSAGCAYVGLLNTEEETVAITPSLVGGLTTPTVTTSTATFYDADDGIATNANAAVGYLNTVTVRDSADFYVVPVGKAPVIQFTAGDTTTGGDRVAVGIVEVSGFAYGNANIRANTTLLTRTTALTGRGIGTVAWTAPSLPAAGLSYQVFLGGTTSAAPITSTSPSLTVTNGFTIGSVLNDSAGTGITVTPTALTVPTAGTVRVVVNVADSYESARAGIAVTASISGRNSGKVLASAITDADGNAIFTYADTNASGVASTLTDTLTFTTTSPLGASVSNSFTVTYVSGLTVSTVALTTPDTTAGVANLSKSNKAIAYADGVEAGAFSISAKVTTSTSAVLAGLAVTFTVAGDGVAITSTTATSYTDSTGTATASIYGWKAGTYTVTATASGVSGTGTVTFAQEVAASARTVSATAKDNVVTALVKDRLGNPVKNSLIFAKIDSGTGYFGGSLLTTNTSTDSNGQAKFVVIGDATITVSNIDFSAAAGTQVGQTSAPKGYPVNATTLTAFTAYTAGTTTADEEGVGASFDAAGVSAATVTISGNTPEKNASEAATDAAAEAIDAANAATDAANLAAEAADAATVAAEEARDAADAATAAVEELATQVATLMAALKAQITTLANTVAKIAKKVKA